MSSKKLFNRIQSISSHLRIPSRSARCATATAGMATGATISLTPDTSGVLHVPKAQISHASCKRACELLQKNHDDFHMYVNQLGFHNHIAHHLLSIFALGATPPQIQQAFDGNANYQRLQFPVDKDNVQSMADPESFQKYLGNERYFHDYEIFFRKEIERHNGDWGSVLYEHLFADTEKARDLLVRMFAGLYHPIIHLGFGIEFEQPAIITEALAQAATHERWPKDFIEQTAHLAEQRKTKGEKARSLFSLLSTAREDKKLRESAQWEDGNKLRDGVLTRAFPEITDLCSQWFVTPTKEDVRFRTAEMINACAYFAGAAQHASRKKQVKFDFFYVHCVNCSIFYSAFLDPRFDSWLKDEDRVRLLQFKGWSDLAMYVSRGSPQLFVDEIKNYKPKQPSDGWPELFARVVEVRDDGHASKLVRALANGEKVCAEYEGKEGAKDWVVKGDMWLKLGHMAIDSVEGASTRWARNVGFDQAWETIPDRIEEPNDMADGKNGVNGSASLNGVSERSKETV